MLLKEDKTQNGMAVAIYDTISDIPAEAWDAVNPDLPFNQRHHFLETIEQIQPEIHFRYVVIKEKDTVAAIVYLQLLDFSFRNLVNYSGESTNGIKTRFKKYMSNKNAKLLNLGNVFFTGDKGIIAKDETAVIALLPQIFECLKRCFPDHQPGAYLVANIYMEEKDACMDFCNSAFHPFITEPDMFLKMNDEWKTFDDYMNMLSSKYRVRARKVLSVSKEIIQKELSGQDITEQQASLDRLYNNVVNHVAFNMATLNVEFFSRMKSIYGNNCTVFGYYINEELVGFACLFHVDPGVLHVHYIGLNYEVNKEHKLYNRMLLDFVRFAIEHRVQKVHFGRTATEIKSTIGAEPNPLQAYLKMNNRLVNAALPYFLKRIKPQEYIARSPFKGSDS